MTQFILDLISQLKLSISQEYEPQSWLLVNRDQYLYYREYALSKSKIQEPNKNTNLAPQPVSPTPKEKKQPIDMEVVKTITPNNSTVQAEPIKKMELSPSTLEVQEVKTPQEDFSDIIKIIKERFPEHLILPHKPEDTLAKTIKNSWKNKPIHPELLFIVSSPKPEYRLFLENLLKAVKIVFGIQAAVIEQQPIQKTGKTVVLNDLDHFFKYPSKKVQLWSEITNQLKKN